MVDINRTIFSLNRQQEERHTQELAQKLGLSYIDLSNYPIAPEILGIIPREMALLHQAIPYLKIGSQVKVAVTDPENEEIKNFLADLGGKTKLSFQMTLVSKSGFLYGLLAYERKNQLEQDKKLSIAKEKQESFEEQITDLQSAAAAAKKVTVTRLLDVIINGAVKTKASDIHLEPTEQDFLVRYRIDGVLQDVVRLPKAQFPTLLSRIKYMAKLRMDTADKPQDGRFSLQVMDINIDLRVSTMPSAAGESVAIRLLGQEKEQFRLDLLGFRSDALSVIRAAIDRPHGMILTSGPTGSGKSSTLYALIMELNNPDRKIITLEDPIEYRIEGIEQSQIDSKAEYSFADGLRASLRQDPDIIMVGEVRDTETSEIAIQAALTGHLVLSTVHANSAPSVFTRLLDIGVKPFLLSGSINLVMAQRLVRKLCPDCAVDLVPDVSIWQEIKRVLEPIKSNLPPDLIDKLDSADATLKSAKGCQKCNSSGFMGRLAIIEVLIPDEGIEALIRQKAGISQFEKMARESGMVSMEQDGLMKVLTGLTTAEEVWRVTKE